MKGRMWKKEEVSHCCYVLGFPCGAVVQNPSTNEETQETWVRSLGREDPLEEEMATHSSTLAWKIPWTEQPGGLQSPGSQRAGHDRAHRRALAVYSGFSENQDLHLR